MGKAGMELLETLGDFTSRENWDKFFTIRGSGDAFEWYAEWPGLGEQLLSQLSSIATTPRDGCSGPGGDGNGDLSSLQILVPGCGSSRMSEHLYDAGYRNITNIDFSKVVISDMLHRNVRARPEMRWRVMDMTEMQFADEFCDAVLDKGGLDALMEPKLGAKIGSKFLKEVKRLLKLGGKYVCLTLAESHVLGLLFSEFRFGWKMIICDIPQKFNSASNFQTYMVAAEKEGSAEPHRIILELEKVNDSTDQGCTLAQAVQDENKIRIDMVSGVDVIYSLEDLTLGAKGILRGLAPGCRCRLVLGEQGDSCFTYDAVLLDSRQQADRFLYHCAIFIVPKIRAHEWLFSSEEGQWTVVESSKAARLIMVFLDSRHSHASIEIIQKDLSPLVKSLAPEGSDNEAPIPFMMASDGVKQKNIVKRVTSAITGPIIVEDVVYENPDGDRHSFAPPASRTFRRLIFERSLGLIQSEALLMEEEYSRNFLGDAERSRGGFLKHQKKGTRRRRDSCKVVNGPRSNLMIDHSHLASCYHSGIISGFILVSSALEKASLCESLVKTVVVGLGAGLLPTHLRGCLPLLDIEVVELDPVILDLAKEYFGLITDEKLKVHIGDGLQFVQRALTADSDSTTDVITDSASYCSKKAPNGTGSEPTSTTMSNIGMQILIVDADASDVSSGLTCPPADFLEEPFLLSVRRFIGEGGLFIINLVSRSTTIREKVLSRMKSVFNHLFSLQLEEDINEVIFALSSEAYTSVDNISEMVVQFQGLLKFNQPGCMETIIETAKKIKCLK